MEKQKTEFIKKLRHEYRGFWLRMALIFGALAWITIKVLWHIATQDSLGLPRDKSIHLGSEWAVLAFIGLPWLAAILFTRMHLKHRREHPDYQQSIAGSLRAMLDSNRLAIKRLRIMVALNLAGLPVLALCISQIYDAGKIRPHELKSMIALFSVVIAVALVCFGIEYFRKLVPRQRELEALLNSYE